MWPFKKKLVDYVPDIEDRLTQAATFLRTSSQHDRVSHVVGKVNVNGYWVYLILDVRRTTNQ